MEANDAVIKMMELPNFSRQLMQQLWFLRNEGLFCDCTILVGESGHRAHKVVLAAASQLFRSLLDSSDSISIDTTVVSSQEFSCLLDMIYTGKLPLGKHNVSRIVAAAESLQMFDLAVGFKNVLTTLVTQQANRPNTNPEGLAPPSKEDSASHKVKMEDDREKSCHSGDSDVEPACKRRRPSDSSGLKKTQSTGDAAESSSTSAAEEPSRPAGSSGPTGRLAGEPSGGPSGSPAGRPAGEPTTGSAGSPAGEPAGSPAGEPPGSPAGGRPGSPAGEPAEGPAGEPAGSPAGEPPGSPAGGRPGSPAGEPAGEPAGSPAGGPTDSLLQHSSQLVELLSSVPSVLELLSQAAQSNWDKQSRRVLSRCCKATDPSSVLEELMSRLRDGEISESSLVQLLQAVEQKAPSSFPAPLRSLLQDVERNTPRTEDESELQDDSRNEEKPEREVEADMEQTEEDEKSVNSPADSLSSTSTRSKSYCCRWCKKSFKYKCRMLTHMKRCSLSQECDLQCPQCPKKLPNQRALQRHLAELHRSKKRAKKKAICDLCGRTFAHPSGLVYHKQTEHFDQKPFVCDECGAKFGANSSLKNHMRLHTGEKPYHCPHCDMSFSVAAALSYHTKKKHSEGKMYVCQYCKALFAQSIELTRHVRTHTGDKPYVCRDCGKGYSQASGLTVHLQTFHNLSEPHDCKKCCLSFPTLDEHQQHIQKFHPKEFHKCSTCNKVFSSSALLDKHKATHTGSKPFSCQLCNKSYQQLSGLWYHNRTNHPEVFASQTQQLKTLLQCDLCFSFFPNAASLSKHKTDKHQASESSVHCLYCKADLGGEGKVQEHVCSQHQSLSSDTFSCPLCSLICNSQLELQEHLLSCHMETQQDGQKEQASTSYTVISADSVMKTEDGAELNQEQSQLGAGPHVLVALAGGEEGRSGEVLEVNMYDLLHNSVTFVCENKAQSSDS